MTDEAQHYSQVHKHFAKHDTVQHSTGEYVNAFDSAIYTNTIEGYSSIFKRGMKGVYQHCNKRHLHHYSAEYEFLYNNREGNGFDDAQRAAHAQIGAAGKRLTY
ncbi:MAG: transposase [Gammaproteobacteria bacterium]|nr:transposase [Gammaproteobacteria bacterium]